MVPRQKNNNQDRDLTILLYKCTIVGVLKRRQKAEEPLTGC